MKPFLKRHSPTILSVIAVAGVVVTVVTSARATVKALELIDDDMSEKEKILTAAPCYILPISFGVATIACILGANALNKRQQASLISAYAMLDKTFRQYRKTLVDLHGEEADQEVIEAMAVRGCCDYHQIGVDTPDQKLLWYDEYSGETFEAYEREIMDAEYHLNRNFVMRGYSPLNEFYQFIGLPPTDYGVEVGWSMTYGYSWIDFEHRKITQDDGGRDIYVIDFVFAPDDDYLREWE
ncbi:MAG: DUF6353 family protein [Lachnospiraceae bacterium]|nr:DUF6353 family protein [Lachnospiraceae bacterium]